MKLASDNLLLTGTLPKDVKVAQLNVLLLSLKLKEDGAMPTRKKEILEAYKLWKQRAPPIFCEKIMQRGEENSHVEDTDMNDVAELI